MMRFDHQQHQFYCGIDLHARTLAGCVLDQAGHIVCPQSIAAAPQALVETLAPFRTGLVIACACLFAWYWRADLGSAADIPFVLGHALYMKAIHGAKAKNDTIDAAQIARLLRGGNLPQAYVYPKGMRETRDLWRRRTFLVRQRAELLAHLVNTTSPYNRPPLTKNLAHAAHRLELAVPSRSQ